MILDVLVNSCARPDILEVSLRTFKERVKTSHTLRYVLVEDKVENEERQRSGAEWIEKHRHMFDSVLCLEKKAGPGYWWAPTVRLSGSDFHFHLEDDTEFIVDLDIDPVIEVMKANSEIIEVVLSRGDLPKGHEPRKVVVDDLALTEMDFFSVANGLFNTKLVKLMIESIGWEKRMHEKATLTPISREMGFRKFALGHDTQHYIHVGEKLGYRKGSYKSITPGTRPEACNH